MEVLTDCETRLRDAASKKILIEVALLKTIEARNATSIDTVLRQLQQLRADDVREMASIPMPAHTPAAPPPAPPPAQTARRSAEWTQAPSAGTPPATGAAVAPAPQSPASMAGPDLDQLWHRVMDAVGRVSPFTRSYLLEAHPVFFNNNLLTIGFDAEFADHLELVDTAKNRTLIQTKLNEAGFPHAQVRFLKTDAPANRERIPQPASETPAPRAPAPPAPPPAPKGAREKPAAPEDKPTPEAVPFKKDDFKNDPLIQKALEIFKGQIVEVRA